MVKRSWGSHEHCLAMRSTYYNKIPKKSWIPKEFLSFEWIRNSRRCNISAARGQWGLGLAQLREGHIRDVYHVEFHSKLTLRLSSHFFYIINNYSLKSRWIVVRGEVNILPLFTEIEKNNCFSIYTGSDLYNIFRRKPLKIDLIGLSIHAFTPAILFLFGLRIIHSVGGE